MNRDRSRGCDAANLHPGHMPDRGMRYCDGHGSVFDLVMRCANQLYLKDEEMSNFWANYQSHGICLIQLISNVSYTPVCLDLIFLLLEHPLAK